MMTVTYLVASSGVPPHVLTHPEWGDTIEAAGTNDTPPAPPPPTHNPTAFCEEPVKAVKESLARGKKSEDLLEGILDA